MGEDQNLRVLVLKLLHAHHLDATSVLALEELLDYLKEKNCHVLLCEVRKDALRILRNSGVLSRINRKNAFLTLPATPLCPRPRPSNEPSTSYRESRQR